MREESLGKNRTANTSAPVTGPTLPLGSKTLNENDRTGSKTRSESMLEKERPTPSILTPRTGGELNGLDEIESEQESLGMNGAPEIGKSKTPENMPAALEEIQLTESPHSFPVLREAPSSLESLLEDSAMHLHSLMKGMFSQSEMERAKADVHTFDQHRVATAATVARQIVNVVRAGLDMAKVRVKVEQLKNKSL